MPSSQSPMPDGFLAHHIFSSSPYIQSVSGSCSFLPIFSLSLSLSLSFFFFCLFLGLHLQHMEVLRLGVESGMQLPAYATATATQDLSRFCNLHHSSQQRQILNPLSEVGVEPVSPWILVGFVIAEPRWELLPIISLDSAPFSSFPSFYLCLGLY